MGSGAAGQPMNSDDTSWPFTSPAGRDASKPHEIDLYIEPSPRDSPTALPKLFTTLEPTALPANAREEDLSSTPPSRDSPTTLPTPEAETSPEAASARGRPRRGRAPGAPARTVSSRQAGQPGVADRDDDTPSTTDDRDEVIDGGPAPAPAPATRTSS